MTTISEAEACDLPAIGELAALLYGPGLPPAKGVRLTSRTFVAKTGGGVRGFVIATVADYGFSMSGHLEELAVAEDAQGSGLGQMLVAACEDWMRGEGVETVFLSSLETATSFYERLGYQRCIGPWLFHRLAGAVPGGRSP